MNKLHKYMRPHVFVMVDSNGNFCEISKSAAVTLELQGWHKLCLLVDLFLECTTEADREEKLAECLKPLQLNKKAFDVVAEKAKWFEAITFFRA